MLLNFAIEGYSCTVERWFAVDYLVVSVSQQQQCIHQNIAKEETLENFKEEKFSPSILHAVKCQNQQKSYLSVKRELVQFEVFEEATLDPSPFIDRCIAFCVER